MGEVPGVGPGWGVQALGAFALAAAVALAVLVLTLRRLAARPTLASRQRLLTILDVLGRAVVALSLALVLALAFALALPMLGAGNVTPTGPFDGEPSSRAGSPAAASLADALSTVSVPALLGRNCTRAPFRLRGDADVAGFAQWLQDEPCRFARALAADLTRLQAAHTRQSQGCTVLQRRWSAAGPGSSAVAACSLSTGESHQCLRALCEREGLAQAVILRLAAAPADFKGDDALASLQEWAFGPLSASSAEALGTNRRLPMLWLVALLLAAVAVGLGLGLACALHRAFASHFGPGADPGRNGGSAARRLAAWGLWRAAQQ